MASQAIKLFYVYARADDGLRASLERHLAALKHEGLLQTWHDQEIIPGMPWAETIQHHLESAELILLLVSPHFMASDYCYSVEMRRALDRAAAGQAWVIPILLAPVDWQTAPFAHLQALPSNGTPVKLWSNRDSAFAGIVKGIRSAIDHIISLHNVASEQYTEEQTVQKRTLGEKGMLSIPAALTPTVLSKAVARYHKQLAEYASQGTTELNLRPAFQTLLADMARQMNLTLMHEMTIGKRIRPDGVLVTDFHIQRGYWEAKGPLGNLDEEIRLKIKAGYPLDNALFENTIRAVLYQAGKPYEFDLKNPGEVAALVRNFLVYQKPDEAKFEQAVLDFKEQIPNIAHRLLQLINEEQTRNARFIIAFDDFADLCRITLNPKIGADEIKEMLIQHLLTERLFRKVFDNSDFVQNNAIASKIESVIQALTSRTFNRGEFLRDLDPFYNAIEAAARGIETWSERQAFLNTVYERFFQGFAIQKADTHGIVYTPQEIVDFMVASVDEVLQREFGQSLATPGVKILDPAVGTGNFIVNIIRRVASTSRLALREKYASDLFCNEIMLLPYYIASLNIEREYYEKMGEYVPFEGICFADTLELAESGQLSFFVEENSVRVQREKGTDITVVIGNPPYWNGYPLKCSLITQFL
jgi:hypothetical protein